MSPLETQPGLKQGDDLVKVAIPFVELEDSLKLFRMDLDYGRSAQLFSIEKVERDVSHDQVQTTNLGQTELLLVNTGSVDLFPHPVGIDYSVSLILRIESR